MNPAGTSPDAPRVVVLHGPPGCGKFSIAQELAARNGWALFHNHLTVDLLLALFPFGSPEFRSHRERLWLGLIPEAVRTGRSVIFTFAPETTVDPGFPTRLSEAVTAAGGRIDWVGIHCDRDVLLGRIASDDRARHGKLTSKDLFLELESRGAFLGPALPSGHRVDSTRKSPRENAEDLLRRLVVSGD